MFDPRTAELIRSIPEFPGLDAARLPETLTQAFAEIVSARLSLHTNAEGPSEALHGIITRFRRIANGLETLATLLPDGSQRSSSAYVAAQAHRLVSLASRDLLSDLRPEAMLKPDGISPDISAMLLFLMADQPADAFAVADDVENGIGDGAGVEERLCRALVALVRGAQILGRELDSPVSEVEQDLLSAAPRQLFGDLLDGVEWLGLHYTGGSDDRPAQRAQEIFTTVKNRAVQRLEMNANLVGSLSHTFLFSTFNGPYHLASLLESAAGKIERMALVGIPPPSGLDIASWQKAIGPIAEDRPYLWQNHREAIREGMLDRGVSSVITFPTGAGKSTLSELKCAATLAAGRDVLYLAPTHALVFQVRTNFSALFGATTVSNTIPADDYYAELDDRDAQIAVMTPERCLAMMAMRPAAFQSLGLVVFDECHLLHPGELGFSRRNLDAMLLVLNLFTVAPAADWVLISAMVANGRELAKWIEAQTGRRCLPLLTDWKPTRQARGCLAFTNDGIVSLESDLTKKANAVRRPDWTLPSPGVAIQRSLSAQPYGFFCLQHNWQSTEKADYSLVPLLADAIALKAGLSKNERKWNLGYNKNDVAVTLAARCAEIGLKVLVFVHQKDHAASVAERVSAALVGKMAAPEFDDEAKRLLVVAQAEVGSTKEVYVGASDRATCHHALMLPVERELAERLFRSKHGVNVLAATATLAQGINLPADVVLIVGEARFDEESGEQEQLDPHELLNAAGRAGRAGHVSQGVVLVITNYLITYDATEQSLRQAFFTLRSIFERNDQCLTVTDPLQLVLDAIQDPARAKHPEIRYFLRRIPLPTEADPQAADHFFNRSLAAYHARKNKTELSFNRQVAAVIVERNRMLRTSEAADWRMELATVSGVTVDFVDALDAAIASETQGLPAQTEALLRWVCSWIQENSGLVTDALGYRLTRFLKKEDGQLLLFDDVLFDATWAWMRGDTLLAITKMLRDRGVKKRRGNSTKIGRDFALNSISEISYVTGLTAQIYRKRIDLGEAPTEMSLALATAGQCVREGCASP